MSRNYKKRRFFRDMPKTRYGPCPLTYNPGSMMGSEASAGQQHVRRLFRSPGGWAARLPVREPCRRPPAAPRTLSPLHAQPPAEPSSHLELSHSCLSCFVPSTVNCLLTATRPRSVIRTSPPPRWPPRVTAFPSVHRRHSGQHFKSALYILNG